MIPDKIDNIPLCQPISEFLEMLENKGGIIVDKKISDYHFHELYFKIRYINLEIIKNNHELAKHKKGFFIVNVIGVQCN